MINVIKPKLVFFLTLWLALSFLMWVIFIRPEYALAADYIEDFNTYAVDDLGINPNWTTPTAVNWVVNSITPIEGARDLEIAGGTTPAGNATDLTLDSAESDVTITYKENIGQASAAGGRGVRFRLENSSGQCIADISQGVQNTDLGAVFAGTFTVFDSFTAGVTFDITIDYDRDNNQYTVTKDAGTPSTGSLCNTAANGTNIDRLDLESDRINGTSTMDIIVLTDGEAVEVDIFVPIHFIHEF